jgi:hypothetical protein
MIIDIALTSIIIALCVERYFYSRDMNHQVNDCMKAIMSKTPEDYVHMKSVEDKKPAVHVEPDERLIEQLSDKEYLRAIKEGIDG